MLKVFSGLWAKAAGLLAVLSTVLFAIVGFQRKENKRKQEIIDTHEKKDDIQDQIKQGEQDIEADKDSINTDDWRDHV